MKKCKLVFGFGPYEYSVFLDGDPFVNSGRLDDFSEIFEDHVIVLKPQGNAKGEEWPVNMWTEIEGM